MDIFARDAPAIERGCTRNLRALKQEAILYPLNFVKYSALQIASSLVSLSEALFRQAVGQSETLVKPNDNDGVVA